MKERVIEIIFPKIPPMYKDSKGGFLEVPDSMQKEISENVYNELVNKNIIKEKTMGVAKKKVAKKKVAKKSK